MREIRRSAGSAYMVLFPEAKYGAGYGILADVEEFDCNKIPATGATGVVPPDQIVEGSKAKPPLVIVDWVKTKTLGQLNDQSFYKPMYGTAIEGSYDQHFQTFPLALIVGTLNARPKSLCVFFTDGVEKWESYGVYITKFSFALSDPKKFAQAKVSTKCYKSINNPNAVEFVDWLDDDTYPLLQCGDFVLKIDTVQHFWSELSGDFTPMFSEKYASEIYHETIIVKENLATLSFKTQFPILSVNAEAFSDTERTKHTITLDFGSLGTATYTDVFLNWKNKGDHVTASPEYQNFEYEIQMSDTGVVTQA
jgi:hypothetical protein